MFEELVDSGDCKVVGQGLRERRFCEGELGSLKRVGAFQDVARVHLKAERSEVCPDDPDPSERICEYRPGGRWWYKVRDPAEDAGLGT